MKLIYHWHSFFEIEFLNQSILIDPFISWNPLCDINLENLLQKNIKAIILTHWHFDHVWDTDKIYDNKKCLIITNNELSKYFIEVKWFEKTYWIWYWWEIKFDSFGVKIVSANHWISVYESWWKYYVDQPSWVIITINWITFYHSWDTALISDMKLLWENYNLDYAMLPIWWMYTMWLKDAVIATKMIKSKIVIPMHYDTWDKIRSYPVDFKQKVEEEWISSVKILKPWEAENI